MLICGLKLTHDGGVALLDGDRLVFSVEIEKLANNARYSEIADLGIVAEILGDFGYKLTDVHEWTIDGWDGKENGSADVFNGSLRQTITLGPYREAGPLRSLFDPGHRGEFSIGHLTRPYVSYVHAAGHLASAYVTSPFASTGEPAIVLMWDGGMFPRLYHVDPARGVENGGELFPLIGHAYAMASHHFGPFKRSDTPRATDDLSVAGKLMAYIALGKARPEIIAILTETFRERFEDSVNPAVAEFRSAVGGWGSTAEPSHKYVHQFYRSIAARLEGLGFSDDDVLASMHQFLDRLLVARTVQGIIRWKGTGPWNLCFVGGCALNIKWNSALRSHPLFKSVWIPPFPNDSGSAIGVAAAHLVAKSGLKAITWHSRLGPEVQPTPIPTGWSSTESAPEDLAAFLHNVGAPVVVVDGRAELGPRALGGRSILAPATDSSMKDLLNKLKDREPYRPVAPVCLEEFAPAVFDPGTRDPYMLFDHTVRAEWTSRIPAVLHLDGTARLQTVNCDDNPVVEAVLREYHRLSGIPLLANTSANYSGCGFFPDAASAMIWGRVDTVWSDGVMYRRTPEGTTVV